MKLRYVVKEAMQGKIFVTMLKPGTDLLLAMKEIVDEEAIKSGVILSGVGLLEKGRLRNCKSLPKKYPLNDANRSFVTLEKPLEILAISGIIFHTEDESEVHAHTVLSFVEDDKISVVGGHLLEGCVVFGFAEIVIMELKNIEMRKTFDKETEALQLFAEEGNN